MEYSLLCFSNLKFLLIRTVPRTRLLGLWRVYCIATCVVPSCVCVCVCMCVCVCVCVCAVFVFQLTV